MIVHRTGNLTGTLLGNAIIGFWSSYENKITFVRLINNQANTWQVYVGYQSSAGILGYFDAYSGTGASAAATRYGWSAILETQSGLYFAPTPDAASTWVTSVVWTATSNGYTGGTTTFVFGSNGILSGSFLGSTIQAGFWDSTSGEIVFLIITNSNALSVQHYHGYFSQYSNTQVFNGYFVALAGTGATADVTEYGWQAYYSIPSTATLPPIQ